MDVSSLFDSPTVAPTQPALANQKVRGAVRLQCSASLSSKKRARAAAFRDKARKVVIAQAAARGMLVRRRQEREGGKTKCKT